MEYKDTRETMIKIAVEAIEKYIDRCNNNPDKKPLVNSVEEAMPDIEEIVDMILYEFNKAVEKRLDKKE